MPARKSFTAIEQTLIARIEKTGASLEMNRQGTGFFHASDKALKLIKGLHGIQFLDLFEACDANEVSDEGLAHVKGLTELRYLALGPGISNKGLSHLAALTELRELRLDSASDVTDDGLQYLKNMAKLQRLSLQYTDVQGSGLVHLAGLKKLKELNLDGTPVTAEAVDLLRKALPKCKIIWDRGQSPEPVTKGTTNASRTADQGTGYSLKLRATLRGHSDKPAYAAFSSDGKLLATVGSKMLLWDGATGAKHRATELKQGSLWGAAFSPDGKFVAAGSNGQCVFVWDTASGKAKKHLETDTQVITAVDFDPSGKNLAAGADDGQIYLWDFPTGKRLLAFPASAGDYFCALAFSPDGGTLASCGRESFISLWNIPAGEKQAELHGPAHQTRYDRIQDLAFSPDGHTLASAHSDVRVRIWNPSQEKELMAFECPSAISRLAFHPDGRTLATASDGDTLVRLWNLATGQVFAEFDTNADWNRVNLVTFSPDGRTLVTNGKGGSVLLLSVG